MYLQFISAAKVALLQPSLLHVVDDAADHNLDIGEHAHKTPEALRACSVRDEDDLVFLDTMIKENLDSHESSATTAHLGVKKQYTTVLADAWRERVVVQFRFTSAEVGLNEHAASAAIRDHSLQASLQDAASAKDHDSRDYAI